MKITKGEPGYIDAQKKKMILITAAEFAAVAVLLLIGYFTTGSRLNIWTVVAVLGCLPASKALVGVITIFPYHSVDQKTAREVKEKSDLITSSFDMVVTSKEKIMQVDCIVISNNTVCGYAHSQKTDSSYAAGHIKKILAQNRLGKVSVKIFPDYMAFLTRAEGMNNIASVEQGDTKEKEEQIKQLILNISL